MSTILGKMCRTARRPFEPTSCNLSKILGCVRERYEKEESYKYHDRNGAFLHPIQFGESFKGGMVI